MLTRFMPVLVIDIGASSTKMACLVNSQIVLIPAQNGSHEIPSVVWMNQTGSLVTAYPAFEALSSDPGNSYRGFIHALGSQSNYKFERGSKELSATEMVAALLRDLRIMAVSHFCEPIAAIVLTVPFDYTMIQRSELEKAAAIAGFFNAQISIGVIGILHSCELQVDSLEGNWLICDWGSYGFRASLVSVDNGIATIHASEQRNNLGGDRFDDEVSRHLNGQFLPNSQDQRSAYDSRVEGVKRNMSGLNYRLKTSSQVDPEIGPGSSEFDAFLEPYANGCVALCKEVISRAVIGTENKVRVVSTGGMAMLPAFQKLLADEFLERPLCLPPEAMALGTALSVASTQIGNDPQILTVKHIDSTHFAKQKALTYAIAFGIDGGGIVVLFEKGALLPANHIKKLVVTPELGLELMHIRVFHIVGSQKTEVGVIEVQIGLVGTEREIELSLLVSEEEELKVEARGIDNATSYKCWFRSSHQYGAGQEAIRIDENVQFSVFRPQVVPPNKWFPMIAFAHLSDRRLEAPPDSPDPIEEVKRQAKELLGNVQAEYTHVVSDSSEGIPVSGEMTFLPEVEGIEFNPPRATFFWLEDVHRQEFRFRANPGMDGKQARGRITVFLGAKIVADVLINIRIDSNVQIDQQSENTVQTSSRPYRKVFASYSHKDTAIVEEVERIIESFGDSYLRDSKTLRSGENWDERLETLINEADIFQLFWSHSSMRSDFVRREWEHAVSLNRTHFVRPVYWENPLPEDQENGLPPDPLNRLHFQRLNLRQVVEDTNLTKDDLFSKSDNPAVGKVPTIPIPMVQSVDFDSNPFVGIQDFLAINEAVSSSSELEDFDFNPLDGRTYHLQPGESKVFSIPIQNPGISTSSYRAIISGLPEVWSESSYLLLDAGETGELSFHIRVPLFAKCATYPLTLNVERNERPFKRYRFALHVESKHEMAFAVGYTLPSSGGSASKQLPSSSKKMQQQIGVLTRLWTNLLLVALVLIGGYLAKDCGFAKRVEMPQAAPIRK